MLILTRKPGESLYIGDNIKITIVEIKGHQIRVGIDAPRDFRIYREEIYLQILEENKQAAEAGVGTELGALEGWKDWPGDVAGKSDLAVPGKIKVAQPIASKSAKQPVPTRSDEPQVVIKRRKAKQNDE